MFDRIKMLVEEHPYISGSVVLGIIVLFIASRSSSSSASAATAANGAVSVQQTGPSDAVQVAQIQAATAGAADQNQAVVQTNLANAALAAKQLDDQTAVTTAGYARDVQLQNLSLSADVQKNSNDFAYKTTVSNNNTTVAVTQSNNATALGEAAISTQAQTSLIQSLINAALGKSNSATPAGPSPSPAITTNGNGFITSGVPLSTIQTTLAHR